MYSMTFDSIDHSIKHSHQECAFSKYPLLYRYLFPLIILIITVPLFSAASLQAAVMNNPISHYWPVTQTGAINVKDGQSGIGVDAASANSPYNSLMTGGPVFFNGDDESANVVSFAQSARESSSQFGTVRVQFNTDDDVDLNGSSIDLLAPLYSRPNTMLFTQLSGRNRDGRNTLNLGAGARRFTHSWMYGINSFFDNDFTGTNRRLGLGAELWTNYVKLSSNLYYRIKDWSHSRDFEGLDERPANGYDMRGDAYLPFFPQLGARMVFEQYFGYGVALFDKNKQLENPRALIVGLNYTPVPLLTLAVEQRVGSGDQSEDRISLQINYRLGLSWREQFSPQGVAAIRTLAVSRYDSVERNGDMVLDYQQ